ncbi:MAG TPA: autotransporter domain-containing protein, partial [Gammaproteobacteria bacterium]|nr:autotransporter domain-containing protein [Gammaproteobacteria bacterium]
TNDGVMSADETDAYISGVMTGNIVNNGTLNSYYSGVYIDNSSGSTVALTGDITNTGKVNAYTYGFYVGGGMQGNFTNTGTILSEDGGLYVDGAMKGDISNSGTVRSFSDTAIHVGGDLTGNLTNRGKIEAGYDYYGVYVDGNFNGNLTNSGAIQAHYSYAVYVSGMMTGNIDNSGTIGSGEESGIYISGAYTGPSNTGKYVALNGSITNSGSIAAYYGIDLGGDLNGSITNAGTIASADTGVYVSGDMTGNLTNSGTVTSQFDYAVELDSTLTGNVTNSGKLATYESGSDALYVSGPWVGSLENTGSIEAPFGTAVYLGSGTTANGATDVSMHGNIENYGTISGGSHAVYLGGDLNGTLTNVGTIASSSTSGGSAAVYVGGAYDILNENTIDGANGLGVAIAGNTSTSAQGKSGTLTNVGLINGGVILGQQNDTVQVAGGVITGPVDGGAGTNEVDFAAASYTALPTNSYDHFQKVYFAKGVTKVESAIDSSAAATSAAVLKGATLDLATGGSINVGAAGALGNEGTVIADGGSITGSFGNYGPDPSNPSTIVPGTLEVPISSTTDYGTLTTSAGADLGKGNGGTLEVAMQGQHYTPNGSTYSGVVKTSAGVANVPSTIEDNSAVLAFTDTVNGTNLDLTAHRVASYASLSGGNPLAKKLDAIGASGSYSGSMDMLLGQLDALPTGSAVKQAVDSMSPQSVGSSLQGAEIQANQVGLTIDNRLRGELNLAQNGRTGMSAGDAYLDSGVWVQGFLSYAHQDGGSVLGGYAAHSHGGVIGYDTLVTPSLRLGLAYANGTASVEGRGAATGQSLDLHTDQFSIYGSYVPAPRWYVDGQVAYGFHRNASRREVSLGGQTALGNFDSHQYSIRAEVGRSFGKRLELTPLARVRYSRLDTQGYTETGAGMYDLRVPSQTSNLGAASLGLRVSGHVTDNIVPDASIAYRHAFGDVQQSTTAEIVSTGTTFSTKGLARKSNVGVLQLGAMIYDGNNLTLHLAYELDKASGYTAHTGMLKLRLGF